MTKRFLFSLFSTCFLIGVIYAELNVDGFCNPNFNTSQNPGLINSTHTGHNENPLQVIQASSHFLILRFQLPRLKIQTQLQNGNAATHIGFDRASWTTETGKPKLPVYTAQIGLPTVSSVTATVLQKQSTFKKVELPLIINQITDPFFSDSQQGDDSTQTSTLYPTEMVEVVPMGFVRSQRIGGLHIRPVQYNSTTQQIKITNDITFRIDFYGAPTTASKPLLSHSLDSAAYENLYQTMLINNAQASSWRQRARGTARTLAPAAPAAPASQRRRFKIPITTTTMYRISYNKLKSSDIIPETIDLDSIRIETLGHEQGFYVFDENQNETLDQTDMIVFYARALISNKFTDTNFYWFSFAPKGTESEVGEHEAANTFRIGTRSGAPVTQNITPPDAFLTKLRFEENRLYDTLNGYNVKSELADHYFWTGFRGGNSGISTKKFPVELPGSVPRDTNFKRDAILHVKLQGAARKNAAKHKAVFYFNTNDDSKPLGREELWLRQESPLITRNIPQNRIHDGKPNELRIVAKNAKNQEGSYDFYLDWYEFEYWHNFRARSDQLEFNSNTEPEVSGITHFNVTNLSTETIDVYTLNSSGLAAKLIDGKVTGGNNSYQILFEDDTTHYTRYFVIANNRYQSVNVLTEVPPSTLRNPTTQADYIVITHKTFLESVQPLVDFRRSQGLTVKVVDIDEIYNEFGHGLFDPFAIRTFLRIAYQTWQSPAPTYVLLVGDAHYDYKQVNNKRYPTHNFYPIFVPTYHGWSPEGGETAMDQRFVNIVGEDALPDMFIGRLSVQTPNELTGMIKKIINYEDNPKIGPWQATLVQVADDEVNNPNDETFEISRDNLIQQIIPVAYHTKPIYLRKVRIQEEYKDKYVPETKRRILKAFNDGALVIEYAGHGGRDTWADEAIFHVDDVINLRNRYLPFVVSTTCLNGKFDKPQQFGSHSLSEQLLMGRYGAIASLTATRLTYAAANAEFDKDLFTAMFVREPFEAKQGGLEIAAVPPSIGKIVTDAKIRFITRNTNQNWIPGAEQYTLFGDPATQLALPTLDIQVELEDIALNSSKQIVILDNEVGAYDADNMWWRAENFDTNKLIVSAIFQNYFDDKLGNEINPRIEHRVWQGQYGKRQIAVPAKALPGKGYVQLFAHDNKRAAAGGATFWVDTPIIADVREVLDAIDTHTLSVQALILDDLGGEKGIRSIEVLWDNNDDYKDHLVPMVKTAPPLDTSELAPGGQWYKIQTPIPLPLGGKKVRYRIIVTDTSGLEVSYPSSSRRKNVEVPAGANIAIATDGKSHAPIRYAFDEKSGKYHIIAELINDGERTVKTDVDVIFSEGNPDVGGDLQIDEGADILGTVTLQPDDWQEGDTVLQRTVVTLKLKENLATGVHKIFVLADPEVDTTDEIDGNVPEPDEFDNKLNITFVVNEFFYEPSQPLEAFSLDRVFDIDFPVEAATVEDDRVPLNVSSGVPSTLTQPSLQFAPIPRIAALRKGLLRTGAESIQQYEVSFRASDVTLKKPVTLKLRFDVSGLEDIVRENTPWPEDSKEFRAALIEEAEKLSIYAWHADYQKWEKLPSQVSYATENEKPQPEDDEPIFQLENYVTPTEFQNANKQPLPIENIKISPESTPAGTWIILFLNSTQYEVYFKDKHYPHFDKLDTPGQLDIPFREENYGIEFTIPKKWVAPELEDGISIVPFEFADILIFETDYSDGAAYLKGARNQNLGDGTATVIPRIGLEKKFAVGDWFLFFLSADFYQLRDKTGQPFFLPNEVPVRGQVNKSEFFDDLGFEMLVTSGSEPFQFGDKIKFSSALVGTITAQTTELMPFTLMSSDDVQPPTFNLWVDGVQPQTGSVIAPRPLISILLEDADGVNLNTLIIRRGDNGKPLEPISDYVLRNPKNVNTVPIDYKPIFFPGEYAFEIEARDFNGNAIGGKAEKIQTRFVVIEMPDITPPVIEVFVNDEVLVGEVSDVDSLGELKNIAKNRITQQPHCEIQVTDETALDGTLLNITFNRMSVNDATQRYREFDIAEWEFDADDPEIANFSFAPDLPNGTYRLQVTATDTSENTTELETVFTLDEAVTLSEVFNVPNPVQDGKTFFTYQLAQPPDKVTIKIYTVSGRLIRTISDASANRGNNETYWDGKDETGVRCANGVYLYRIIAHTDGSKVEKVGKLAILR